MRTNLSSQISLSHVARRLYKPDDVFELSRVSRTEKVKTSIYETGTIKKGPLTEKDIGIVEDLLPEVKPDQIFVAGDLADPHGTHRVCTDAVIAKD